MATVNLERSTGTCTSVSSAGSLILYPGAKPIVVEAVQLDYLPGPQIPNSKFQIPDTLWRHRPAERCYSQAWHWHLYSTSSSAAEAGSLSRQTESGRGNQEPRKQRNHREGRWSHTLGISIGCHHQNKWQCEAMCRHAIGEHSHHPRRTSHANCRRLIHRLNGATLFSKLDLQAGYHQLTLDKESRYITTFCHTQGSLEIQASKLWY